MENIESMEIFSQLKSIYNSPKLYLVNFFEDIRNRIDVQCQVFLNNIDLDNLTKEKALQQQQDMIDQVDLFQSRCLANLESNHIDQMNFKDIDHHSEKRNMCSELYKRQKVLFMNKGIVFLSIDKCDELFELRPLIWNDLTEEYEEPKNSEILLGILILIEDEFLLYSRKFNIPLRLVQY